MSMPGMSGRQILQRIRALGIDVPVLICSGHGDREVSRKFSGLNIAGVLEKAFAAGQLDEMVSHALQVRQTVPTDAA